MEGPVSARLDSMASCSHRCYGDSHSSTLPMRKRLRFCNPRQSYGQQLETASRRPTLSALRALPAGMQQNLVFRASICSSSWCQPAWSHHQSQRSPTVVARVAAPERAQVRYLILDYMACKHAHSAENMPKLIGVFYWPKLYLSIQHLALTGAGR